MSALSLTALERGQDRIVLCAPISALFQGLTKAIEDRLNGYQVDLCRDLMQQTADPAVILVYKTIPERQIASWCLPHRTPVVLVVDGMDDEVSICNSLFENELIKGVLPLAFELDVWIAALRVVLGGGEFYPFSRRPSISSHPLTHVAKMPVKKSTPSLSVEIECLTRREREILDLIAKGLQNKIIADMTGLSEHTVKVHVHNLIGKLNVRNRTQAAAICLAQAKPQPGERA